MSRAQQPKPAADTNTAIMDRRNPGAPFDFDWLRSLRASRDAIERSVGAIAAQTPPRGDQQAALLLRAVTCFDLTPAAPEVSRMPLRAACATARQPISPGTLRALGAQHLPLQVGALCVGCDHIADAARALRLSGIPVAGRSSAAGPLEQRLEEIASCAADGAEEIDAELSTSANRKGDWPALYSEVTAIRSACGPLALKALLPACVAPTPGRLFRAVIVCAMAGADFVSVPWSDDSAVQAAAVALRAYHERTSVRVGLKLNAGIGTARQTLDALALVRKALGAEWIRPALFRMATDASLAGVDRQLEHYAHGPAAWPSRRAA